MAHGRAARRNVAADDLERAIGSTIGHRVREYRTERSLTVAQLAEQSGISKGMLSKVENAHASASLATLARLAEAMSVPVTALFRGLEEEHDAYFVRAGKGIVVDTAGSRVGHVYELLGESRGPYKRIEPVRVRLERQSEVFPLYQHTGTEFIYMLGGTLEYGYGNARYTLLPGDSLQFEGDVPHGPTQLVELPIEFLTIKAWGRVE